MLAVFRSAMGTGLHYTSAVLCRVMRIMLTKFSSAMITFVFDATAIIRCLVIFKVRIVFCTAMVAVFMFSVTVVSAIVADTFSTKFARPGIH